MEALRTRPNPRHTNQMGKRDASIDAVRVIGILAIVFGHIIDTEPVRLGLYTWHVPVFFFLSGYLWTSGRGIGDEVRRRSSTLLRPYAFWLVVLLAAFVARAAIEGWLTWETVAHPLYGGAVVGRPFSTFWFVFVLFASAVLWRLLERTPVAARIVVVLVGVAGSVFFGPELAHTPLAIGSAIPALAFLGAGQLARTYEGRLIGPGFVGAGFLAASAVLIIAGMVAPFDIKQGEWGTPVVSVLVAAIISWGLVLVARPIMAAAGERVSGWVTSFALVGFTIVLAHPAVLWLLQGVGAPVLVKFALAVGMPALIGAVALRTPLSGWVTGVPQRKTRQPIAA